MPRDAAGNYTLPSGNPVVSGTTITSAWANATMTDLAEAITNSLSRNGQGGMEAPLKFADGSVTEPGIAFGNQPSTGFYRANDADLRMSLSGSDAFRFWRNATTDTLFMGASSTIHVGGNGQASAGVGIYSGGAVYLRDVNRVSDAPSVAGLMRIHTSKDQVGLGIVADADQASNLLTCYADDGTGVFRLGYNPTLIRAITRIGPAAPDSATLNLQTITGNNDRFNQAIAIGLGSNSISQGGWIGSRSISGNQAQGLALTSTNALTLCGGGTDNSGPVLQVLNLNPDSSTIASNDDNLIANIQAPGNDTGVLTLYNRCPSSNRMLLFNRSNGDNLGSIGSDNASNGVFSIVAINRRLQLYAAQSGRGGISFNLDSSIVPVDHTGEFTTNVFTLGNTNTRFRDLFLSRNAYIGQYGSVIQQNLAGFRLQDRGSGPAFYSTDLDGAVTNNAADLGDGTYRWKNLYLAGLISASGTITGGSVVFGASANFYGRRVNNSSSLANIFVQKTNGKSQTGLLFVKEEDTARYLIAVGYKQSENNNPVMTVLANNGLTISAVNSGGTIAISGFGSSTSVSATILITNYTQ